MTKEILGLELKDGSLVLIEAVQGRAQGPELTGLAKPEQIGARKFEKALEFVAPAARAVMSMVRSIEQPDATELEFGLKLSADLKAFVVSANGEANFRVLLRWEGKNAKHT